MANIADGWAYQLHQIKLPNIGFIKTSSRLEYWQKRWGTARKPQPNCYHVAIQCEKKLITHVNGDLAWNIDTKIVIGTNIADILAETSDSSAIWKRYSC